MRPLILFFTLLVSYLPAQEKPATCFFTLSDTAFSPGCMLRTYTIRWTFDKVGLHPDCYPFLDSVVAYLKKHPSFVLETGSYTDSRGSADYNLQLSQARAQTIVNYFVQHGIPGGQVTAKGYGETNPIVPEKIIAAKVPEEREALYQLNRRTEFKMLYRLVKSSFALTDTVDAYGKLVTYTIHFLLNKDSLLPESYPFLDSMVTFLQHNPNVIMEIGVHCDSRASPNFAHQTMNRASHVEAYLIRKGIRKDRLIAKGYGAAAPLRLPDGTILTDKYIMSRPPAEREALYALNRRVEFRIIAYRAHATMPYRSGTKLSLDDTIFAEGSSMIVNVLYELNKGTIRTDSYATLDSVAQFLLRYPYIDVEIGVHTDSRVSDAYSVNLTEARAKSVVDYLVSKGVPRERLTAKGYQDSQPRVLPDGTVLTENYIRSKPSKEEQEKLYQMNRRTELKILRVH